MVLNLFLSIFQKVQLVWCPFDTQESEFVKQIEQQNEVIYSHINTGRNFFEYEPHEWDVMVSNPPFTGKRKYFETSIII